MKDLRFPLALLLLGFFSAALVHGQGMRFRSHTANQARKLALVSANVTLRINQLVSIRARGQQRSIESNGIPRHKVGAFPNPGNPNRIQAQSHRYSVTTDPTPRDRTSPLTLGIFGFAVNGVPLEPGAAEFWQGNPSSGWNYEALGGAVSLGLDENHAHVQPTGKYHYHGLPTLLLKRLGLNQSSHSPLVGWAADGHPIYALYGYRDPQDPRSGIVRLESSYQLKDGSRPDSPQGPGGTYDGAFVQDYEYAADLGDLDDCNGRFCVTPEFPEGTYAYFLTEEFPVIPRSWRGTPDSSFSQRPDPQRMGPGGPGGFRPPPGSRPPPPPGGKGPGRLPPPPRPPRFR